MYNYIFIYDILLYIIIIIIVKATSRYDRLLLQTRALV